jgi:hypothetical protein
VGEDLGHEDASGQCCSEFFVRFFHQVVASPNGLDLHADHFCTVGYLLKADMVQMHSNAKVSRKRSLAPEM